jgi:hypothetical protein
MNIFLSLDKCTDSRFISKYQACGGSSFYSRSLFEKQIGNKQWTGFKFSQLNLSLFFDIFLSFAGI